MMRAMTKILRDALREARGAFDQLERIWKHTSLGIKHKMQIFDSLVVSKLRYGMESLCLKSYDRKRLNTFHTHCLRKICGIGHSFHSRVPNIHVHAKAMRAQMSNYILQAQTNYYATIATDQSDSILKEFCFGLGSNSLCPRQWNILRKIGRPRFQWLHMVFGQCLAMVDHDMDTLHNLIMQRTRLNDWTNTKRKYFHKYFI